MVEYQTPYEIMSDFVNLIEKERIRQNLRQQDLYKASGMSSTAYANFLKNKTTSFENVIKLLYTLNMIANIEGLLKSERYTSINEIRQVQKKSVKKRVRKDK